MARIKPSEVYSTASVQAAIYGLGGVVRNVLALLTITTGYVLTRGLDALGTTFIEPLFALGDAGAAFVNALFADPAAALGGAWEFMLTSVTSGSWAFFGPLTPIIVFGVILGVIAMYLKFADVYNIDLPTTGNIPFLSLDDSSADEEE